MLYSLSNSLYIFNTKDRQISIFHTISPTSLRPSSNQKKRARVQNDTPSSANKDPYLFDREDLQKITDDATIHAGLTFYKENRVIEIDIDQNLLWGRVEDADSDIHYDAELRLSEDKQSSFSCSCETATASLICQFRRMILQPSICLSNGFSLPKKPQRPGSCLASTKKRPISTMP